MYVTVSDSCDTVTQKLSHSSPSSGKRRDCTEVDHNLVLGPYKKIDATESRPLRTIRGGLLGVVGNYFQLRAVQKNGFGSAASRRVYS